MYFRLSAIRLAAFHSKVKSDLCDLINRDAIRVVIPAYNAENEIPSLLKDILRHIPLEQVIVVDDGSHDRTGSMASSFGATVVRHTSNRGKGAALQSGLKSAFNQPSVDACLMIDADGQHDPEFIPAFWDAYISRGGDLIIGARQLNLKVMPLMRVLSNRITSFLISAKVGQPILDSQCGYRLISRRIFSAIDFESQGFEIESEMVIKANQLGMNIVWVPISTIYNNEKSYIKGFRDTFGFIRTWLRY